MTKLRQPDKLTLIIEEAKRKKAVLDSKPMVMADNFKHQTDFVDDPSRFLAAQCSRRAGKSNALALKFFRTMEKHPGCMCLYVALTRDSAYNIMWTMLQDHDEKYKIGCTFTQSNLTITHPNGARLRLIGADSKNFIRRLKGIECAGVAVDEAQDFGSHLESLVYDVLTPTLAKYQDDGWVALTGTPGPVPSGFFFEVTQEGKHGYSVHKWTILDNPHIPKATDFIQELITKRRWESDNPTLMREWRNQWKLDLGSLWVRYREELNHYTQLPTLSANLKYSYIMGVDIGYNDADALAVVAYSDDSPKTYLVEELITPKQGITELADQIKALQKKYDVHKIVMDAGALGKKIQEELTRRFAIPVEAADKQRKQENVEFLNDAMRVSNFMAKSASRFAQDSYMVQIDWDRSTPDKIIIKKKPHSDIIDAVLYAFKLSPAYSYEAPTNKPKYGSREWAQEVEKEMFEKEIEGLRKEQERESGFDF